MADVTLTYKGDTIAELSESGSKTLETAGKYCEADILLEYEKSGGSDGGLLVAEGTFEVTDSDITDGKIVTHNLGVVPFFVEVEPVTVPSFSGQCILSACAFYLKAGTSVSYTFDGRTSNFAGILGIGFWGRGGTLTAENYTNSNNNGNYISAFTSTTFRWRGGSSYPIYPGTYKWRAFAFKELEVGG